MKNIAEMGAYVSLLEYNNIEGMILLSELSRRRIRSISSLIKVGRQEPVMVVRVDKEKGYIDLSKRRVSEEDIARCEERYNKSKLVHSIMRHVADTLEADLEVNFMFSRRSQPFLQCSLFDQVSMKYFCVVSKIRVNCCCAQYRELVNAHGMFEDRVDSLMWQDIYTHVGWPLYKKYGHAFEVGTNSWRSLLSLFSSKRRIFKLMFRRSLRRCLHTVCVAVFLYSFPDD